MNELLSQLIQFKISPESGEVMGEEYWDSVIEPPEINDLPFDREIPNEPF